MTRVREKRLLDDSIVVIEFDRFGEESVGGSKKEIKFFNQIAHFKII